MLHILVRHIALPSLRPLHPIFHIFYGVLQNLALVHTHSVDPIKDIYQQAQYLFPLSDDVWSVDVTPVLGAHLGPGTFGFACITK